MPLKNLELSISSPYIIVMDAVIGGAKRNVKRRVRVKLDAAYVRWDRLISFSSEKTTFYADGWDGFLTLHRPNSDFWVVWARG